MKYFLAVDSYPTPNYRDRYHKIKLDKISSEKDLTDLKNLCFFTMTFRNEEELREFLESQKLYPKKIGNLVICYEIKGMSRALKIPYKSHEKYFSFSKLLNIVKNNILNKDNYLASFLNLIDNNYKTNAYYLLMDLKSYFKSEEELFERLTNFFNEVCFPTSSHLNFKRFYDLAMLTYALDNPDRKVAKYTPRTSNLTETQKIEYENRLTRHLEDEQICLF